MNQKEMQAEIERLRAENAELAKRQFGNRKGVTAMKNCKLRVTDGGQCDDTLQAVAAVTRQAHAIAALVVALANKYEIMPVRRVNTNSGERRGETFTQYVLGKPNHVQTGIETEEDGSFNLSSKASDRLQAASGEQCLIVGNTPEQAAQTVKYWQDLHAKYEQAAAK